MSGNDVSLMLMMTSRQLGRVIIRSKVTSVPVTPAGSQLKMTLVPF